LLVSDDGGVRWSSVVRLSDPLYATAYPGGRLWAAQVVPGFGVKASRTKPEIWLLNSVNGGRSWRPLGELPGLAGLTASTVVHLAAGAHGLEWASAFDPEDCAMHGCGTAALYQSADGGRNWKIVDLSAGLSAQCGPDSTLFSLGLDGTTWAGTGENGGACSPPLGVLYRHDRSGWRELPPWQLAGVSWLGAVDRDVAYAISGETTVVRTDDGGLRWTQLLPALAPTGQLDALDQTTALGAQDATDAGAVLRSIDAGRSWQLVSALPGIITQLDFTTPRRGVAVTFRVDRVGRPQWRLWRSDDGGQSWKLVLVKAWSSGVWGPWMSEDGRGVLLRVAGAIAWQGAASGGVSPVREWATEDWGAHWRAGKLLPVNRETVGQASFVSGTRGHWLGWIIVATPAGSRVDAIAGRTLVTLRSSPSAEGVQLLGPATGVAWGFSGWTKLFLYGTTDGGRHWQRARVLLPRPQLEPLAGRPLVGFTDPDHGWLVLGATTWHTSDGGRTWRQA
jgi:photosystem II stability/assembly factor-like uncharacterized protein